MKRKNPYKLTTYVPEEKEGCVKQFIEICEREGESASKKLLDFIGKYVDLHKNGNPQTLMPSFTLKQRKVPSCQNLLHVDAPLKSYRGWCKKLKQWVKGNQCLNCKRR